MRCNTEITGRITLPEVRQTYENTNTENAMSWEVELNPPKKSFLETNGLLDHEAVESPFIWPKGTSDSGRRRETELVE